MNAIEITIPPAVVELYAKADKERFPSFHEVERPSTLFYADIKTAEPYGINAVKETLEACHLEWRDPRDLTELYTVLNALIWEAYESKQEALYNLYSAYYNKIYDMSEGWSEEEQEHFFLVTD